MNDINMRKCSLSTWLNAMLSETKNFRICSSRSSLVIFIGLSCVNNFPSLKKWLIEGEDAVELLRLILRQTLSIYLLIIENTFESDRPGYAKLLA